MPESEIICLANSRKHAGRCVVGLRTDGIGWVRPVSSRLEGTLFEEHYILEDGSEVQVLDVLRIPLKAYDPKPHQPENYIIENGTWKLVSRPASEDHLRSILYYVDPGPDIFGDQSDRISYDSICEEPVQESAALVSPKNLRWSITRGFSGRRQTRAVFTLGKAKYDLPITDPLWEERLSGLKNGKHSLTKAGLKANDRILFTISLGEPFDDGNCYKLIAAVIVLPDSVRGRF